MKNTREETFHRVRVSLSLIAVGAALAAAALGYFHPADFYFAYRFAGLICFAPAAGSLLFLLINRTTGGQWSETLEPFLVSGARSMPWVWLCALPATWLGSAAVSEPGVHSLLRSYGSTTGIVVRDLIYLVIFFAFRWLCLPSRAIAVVPDASSFSVTENHSKRGELRGDVYRWFGPVGLIVFVFTLHLLAIDWMTAIEPEWHSTSFPLVWMAGQAVAGLALAVLCSLSAGADPSSLGSKERSLGIDWGNLLLTASIFWAYVGFMEFLIIWSGDLPHEVAWYVRRSTRFWRGAIIAVALLHLAIPFFALLSRKVKQSRRPLAAVAGMLLLAQILYYGWLILPSSPSKQPWGLLLDGILGVFGLCLFLNRYLSTATRRPSA